MFLNKETVICIKSNPPAETWDYFNDKTEIINLPKRENILAYPIGTLASKFDYLVEPSCRTETHQREIAKWATHMSIIGKFLEGTTNWLFVIEDNINLSDLTAIVESKGLTLFEKNAGCYLLDRNAAKQIIDNSKIYYAPISQVFQDLATLQIININPSIEFPIIKHPFLFTFMPFFFVIFFFLACLYIVFNPITTKTVLKTIQRPPLVVELKT
jgi:hypothetical protein